MALVNYDLKVTAHTGLESKRDLTARERSRLFGKPVVDTSRPKKAIINRLVAEGLPPEIESQPTSRERLSTVKDGNLAVIAEVDTQMERLSGEAEGLIYEFNPAERPDLARAVASIFEGASSRITFKMYQAALELEAELSLQLGRSFLDGVL